MGHEESHGVAGTQMLEAAIISVFEFRTTQRRGIATAVI
jgi:hypothetical protein